MHNWLEQIEIVQSPTDLDRIEKEINDAIRMAEQDILRLDAEMASMQSTFFSFISSLKVRDNSPATPSP